MSVLKNLSLLFVACCVAVANLCTGQTCPTIEDLKDQKDRNHAPVAEQVDSDTVRLHWDKVWPDVDFDQCFTKVWVTVGGTEKVTIANLTRRSMTLPVTPCEEVRFDLTALLGSTGEEITSSRSQRRFKTFMPPLAKETQGSTFVERLENDPTTLSVQAAFDDLAENRACRKVISSELRYRKLWTSHDDLDYDGDVWSVVKTMEISRRGMDETVTGLDDLCASYEVVLLLEGTEGTDSALAHLGTVEAPSKEQLRKAYDSGFRQNLPQPGLISLESAGHDSISVSWPMTNCADGYVVEVTAVNQSFFGGLEYEEEEELVESKRFTDPTKTKATFTGLEPCSSYRVRIKTFLVIGDDGVMLRSEPRDLSLTTVMDQSQEEHFSVTSLIVYSGRTSATLSWLRSEWPCLGELDAQLCPGNTTETGECLDAANVDVVNVRMVVTFKNLRPCYQYKVIVRPSSSVEGKLTIRRHLAYEEADVVDLDAQEDVEGGIMHKTSLVTSRIMRAPKHLQASALNETAIRLAWESDSCVHAYLLTYTAGNVYMSIQAEQTEPRPLLFVDDNSDAGSLTLDTKTLKEVPHQQELFLYSDDDEEDDDMEGSGADDAAFDYEGSGSDGRAREKRSLVDMNTMLDYESYQETKVADTGSGQFSLFSDDEDYHSSGDEKSTFEGTHGEENELDNIESDRSVTFILSGLEGCTNYTISVFNVYREGSAVVRGERGAHADASTHCRWNLEDMFEGNVRHLFVHTQIGDAGVELSVTWDQRAGMSSTLSVTSGDDLLLTETREAFANDVDQVFLSVSALLKVDYCESYLVVVESLAASETLRMQLFTPPDEREPVALSDFSLVVKEDPGDPGERSIGVAVASWRHTMKCALKYKVELSNPYKHGEFMVIAPSEEESDVIEVDLHMIPGMLTLKSCQNYTLTIIPLNDLFSWKTNFSVEFTYVKSGQGAPNVVPVEFDIQSTLVHLNWSEPLACEDLNIVVQSKRVQASNGDSKTFTVLDSDLDPFESSYTVEGLLPCIEYELVITHSGTDVIATKHFTTTAGEGHRVEPLSEQEVATLSDSADAAFTLNWSGRCDSPMMVELCLSPCEDTRTYDDVEGLQYNRSTNLWSLAFTQDHVSSCSLYEYRIKTLHGQFLFSDRIVTFMDKNYSLDLPEVNISTYEEGFTIEWLDSYPCLAAFNAVVFTNGDLIFKERVARDTDITSIIRTTKVHNVTQCVHYKVFIQPVLPDVLDTAGSEEWTEANTYSRSFLYFVRPDPPSKVYWTTVNATSVKLKWEDLPCNTGYLVEMRSDLATVLNNTIANNSIELYDVLQPCTHYSTRIWSLAAEGKISDAAYVLNFTTAHAQEVEVTLFNVSGDSVELETFSHGGTDCVSHYLMFLCPVLREDSTPTTRVCWNQTVELGQQVTFEQLEEGSDYVYQLLGYSSQGVEMFFTPEHQVATRKLILAELNVTDVSDDGLTLELHSSSFDEEVANDAMEDGLTWQVEVNCTSEENTLTRSALNAVMIHFTNLTSETTFKCGGNFVTDGQTVPLEQINVTTLASVPDAPLSLNATKPENQTTLLSWQQPGQTIVEYEVTVICRCHETVAEACPTECDAQESSYYTNSTELILALQPYRQYSISVAARTENPQFGPASNEIKFVSPAGQPNKPSSVRAVARDDEGTVVLTFDYSCPLNGPTIFSPHAQCYDCKDDDNATISYKTIGKTQFELQGLTGGHSYNVWVRANVSSDCLSCRAVSSDPKRVTIACPYRCRDGSCAYSGKRCNFIRECGDGSDEEDCPCEEPEGFRCSNGHCIQARRRCDLVTDCNDNSDEMGCPGCEEEQFRCDTSGECIPQNATCDRKVHCRDGSDEMGCAYFTSVCWPEQFRCLDHTCVGAKHRCDGIWDCADGEDELSCSHSVCKDAWEFACKSGQCIQKKLYCDGKKDCDDGTDEMRECSCHKNGQFACATGSQCVSRLKVCDRTVDCADGSDEAPCNYHAQNSADNETTRESPKAFANTSYDSEGKGSSSFDITQQDDSSVSLEDEDFSDYSEVRPVLKAPLYNLDLESASLVKSRSLYVVRVYPEHQWVYEGHDAVVQCRDEGDLRSPVVWIRNNVTLQNEPDKRGRLSLTGLRLEDSGEYVCSVKGHENQKDATSVSVVEVRKWRW